MRMWSFGVRRLSSTVRLTSRTLRQPCRPAARVAGSLVVSRAGFTPLYRFFSTSPKVDTVLQAIQAVQNHSSKTVLVAIEKESEAFFLLCPPV